MPAAQPPPAVVRVLPAEVTPHGTGVGPTLLMVMRIRCFVVPTPSKRLDGLWSDPDGHVGVAQSESGVTVGWIDVAWLGPSTPRGRLRDATHIPLPLVNDELGEALEHAIRRRGAKVCGCRYCGERHVPGQMDSKDVCQGCAEQHLGVVH
jgi:hypothetical protein